MKFISHKFWKHRGDCCDFFEVLEVVTDSGETAEVKVSWNTQLDGQWKTIVPKDQFKITKREYKNYQEFNPRGNKL